MIIGLDIDGVLTDINSRYVSLKTIERIFIVLEKISPQLLQQILYLWVNPRSDITYARKLSKQHDIVLITARTEDVSLATRRWLQYRARIQYKKITFVGLDEGVKERKLEYAKKNGVQLFVDDTAETIDYFNNNGIEAHLFINWKQVYNFINNKLLA